MELTPELIEVVKSGAENLEGAPRRRFMAGVVRLLGRGGQRAGEALLGWNRGTVRKGEEELLEGVERPDGRKDNGRPSLEELFPSLLQDLREVVEPFLQVDPTLRSERLYRKLTTREVVQRLVSEKGYSKESLPSDEAIRQRLNSLGYHPQRVRKSKPKKRSPRRTQSSTRSTSSTLAPTPPSTSCASPSTPRRPSRSAS
jgi:hypothetical protein